jgi:hypothetical protein
MRSRVTTEQINSIINLVKTMTEPNDGDTQLMILAYTFLIACKSVSVNKETAMSCLEQMFEEFDEFKGMKQ